MSTARDDQWARQMSRKALATPAHYQLSVAQYIATLEVLGNLWTAWGRFLPEPHASAWLSCCYTTYSLVPAITL